MAADAEVDWATLRGDLKSLITEKGCHPIMIRLSWHDAGTYCKDSKNGGPRACMRHRDAGEATYGCNAGLDIAIGLLKDIKEKHKGVTNADLWALAAVEAIKAAGGPVIPFKYGRTDAVESKDSVPNGRLPDGDKGADHVRQIFYRMGFNDQEIVALSGAHTLGRCHVDRSGFEGAWTDEPLKFDNSYYKDVLNKKWIEKKVEKTGNPQLVDDKGLMMLTTDMALKTDAEFAKYTKLYATDEAKFFEDYAAAFQKLQELGYSGLTAL